MNNRILVLAIGLGLILTVIVPVIIPHFVLAQGCTDARGNPIDCPPPEKKRKTPTPVRPTKTPTPTITSTSTLPAMLRSSITPAVSPTPTLVAALPIIPKGDGLPPQATDSTGGWPLFFGSITHQMQFDGDPFHSFPGGSLGLLGLLGLAVLVFILVRAARINYGKLDDDTSLIFRKRKPKDGSMPLQTEVDIPDTDESSKDAAHMKINFPDEKDPGYRVPYKLNSPSSTPDQNKSVIIEPPHSTARHTKDDDDA